MGLACGGCEPRLDQAAQRLQVFGAIDLARGLGRSDIQVGPSSGLVTGLLFLIPETLRLTKFASKAVGERVNIELDARTVALVDTVERVLEQRFASASEGLRPRG